MIRGLPLEQCAPTLNELIRCRLGHYLVLKLGNVPLQTGIFLLKQCYLLFERRRLLADQLKPLAHDGRRTPLVDKFFDRVEKSHIEKDRNTA